MKNSPLNPEAPKKRNLLLVIFMASLSTPVGMAQTNAVEGPDRVRLSLTASQTEVWPGETFSLDLRLAIRLPPATPARIEPLTPKRPPHLRIPFLEPDLPPGVTGPDVHALLRPLLTPDTSLPALNINDFSVHFDPDTRTFRLLRQDGPATTRARFLTNRRWVLKNGERWVEYTLRSRWQADMEGGYQFGPVVFSGPVAAAVDSDGRFTTWRDIAVTGATATVRVTTPPRNGIPATSFGAAGSSMDAGITIEPQTCRTEDPLQLTLRIGGKLRHDLLQPPRLQDFENVNERFRIHDRTVLTTRGDDSTEFSYVIRPRSSSVHEFPPLDLPWYDRVRGEFTTTTTQPVPLHVLPATRLSPSLLTDRADIPAALRHDRDGWTRWSWRDERQSWRLAAVGPALYLILRILAVLPGKWRSLRRRSRRRTAAFHLRRRLRRLRSQPAVPAMTMARAVRAAVNRFFADILDFNIYSKTPSELWETMADRCPRAMPSAPAREILERCHHQCYTEQPPFPLDPQNDLPRLGCELSRIPRSSLPGSADPAHYVRCRRRVTFRQIATPLGAAILLAILLRMPHADKPSPYDEQVRRHIWNEANALAVSAVEPADKIAARERYRELLASGARNATLFYQYGTLCLETGDAQSALSALRRAASIEGRSRDVRHNLRLAWQHHAANTGRITVSGRIFHAGHLLISSVSHSSRLRIAALIFVAAWLAICRRHHRPPHGSRLPLS